MTETEIWKWYGAIYEHCNTKDKEFFKFISKWAHILYKEGMKLSSKSTCISCKVRSLPKHHKLNYYGKQRYICHSCWK